MENCTIYPMDDKQAASVDRRLARWMAIGPSLNLEQGPGVIIYPTERPYPPAKWWTRNLTCSLRVTLPHSIKGFR